MKFSSLLLTVLLVLSFNVSAFINTGGLKIISSDTLVNTDYGSNNLTILGEVTSISNIDGNVEWTPNSKNIYFAINTFFTQIPDGLNDFTYTTDGGSVTFYESDISGLLDENNINSGDDIMNNSVIMWTGNQTSESSGNDFDGLFDFDIDFTKVDNSGIYSSRLLPLLNSTDDQQSIRIYGFTLSQSNSGVFNQSLDSTTEINLTAVPLIGSELLFLTSFMMLSLISSSRSLLKR